MATGRTLPPKLKRGYRQPTTLIGNSTDNIITAYNSINRSVNSGWTVLQPQSPSQNADPAQGQVDKATNTNSETLLSYLRGVRTINFESKIDINISDNIILEGNIINLTSFMKPKPGTN